jgi:hypothetical protein
MALEDKIEKIKKIEKAEKKVLPQVDETAEMKRMPPNKEKFDTLLTAENPQQKIKVETEQKIDPSNKRNSLFDEVRTLSSKTEHLKVTPAELIAQTNEALNKMTDLQTGLQTPGLELKDSVQTMMRNKLEHVDTNIRIALSKAGVETKELAHPGITPVAAPSENPISRFLGLLTDGQYKLQSLSAEVENWHLNKQEINPATMLALQIKVNYITQELEFFSSLLNKALESTKTIMNVQV